MQMYIHPIPSPQAHPPQAQPPARFLHQTLPLSSIITTVPLHIRVRFVKVAPTKMEEVGNIALSPRRYRKLPPPYPPFQHHRSWNIPSASPASSRDGDARLWVLSSDSCPKQRCKSLTPKHAFIAFNREVCNVCINLATATFLAMITRLQEQLCMLS